MPSAPTNATGSAPTGADRELQPIRLVLHLACTGGTLIARAIQAQRDVGLLSEIDPYSVMPVNRKKNRFAPSDLIYLARDAIPDLEDTVIRRMFLAALGELHGDLCRKGRALVLRVHSHSQYCTDIDPASRPSVPSIVADKFSVLQVATIRHPLDSFLALRHNKWFQFAPFTLHEYCNRSLAFMKSVEGLPRLKYEDFVADPDGVTRRLCGILELDYDPDWRSNLADITLSGNSGRAGNTIDVRTRRKYPQEIALEVSNSSHYRELCGLLDYDPGP